MNSTYVCLSVVYIFQRIQHDAARERVHVHIHKPLRTNTVYLTVDLNMILRIMINTIHLQTTDRTECMEPIRNICTFVLLYHIVHYVHT